MRRFPCLCLTVLSLAAGCAAAALLYRHAWQIPVVRDLRGAQLFAALAITLTPFFALLAVCARRTTWRVALKSAAVFLAIAAPSYAVVGRFEGVRTSSRDKAVLCNLRQLAAAADQYFLENNVSVVSRLEELVGPTKYVKGMNPVAGEDYSTNFPLKNGDFLSVQLGSGRTLVYYPGAVPPGYKHTYERGEVPPWRTSVRAAAPYTVSDQVADSVAANRTNLAQAPALTSAELTAALAKPSHKTHRGTMCASCHAKKA